MKKLIAIALLGFNTFFGYPEQADNKQLMYIRFGIYSNEIPVPIAYLSYDTNNDDREDVAEIYQIEDTGFGIKIQRLLEKDIDRNKDGLYDLTERYIIVDLEKEAQRKGLNDLLKKSKPFQKEDFA